MAVYYQRDSTQTLYPESNQNPSNLTMYLNHSSSSSSAGPFSDVLTGTSSISHPIEARNEMVFIPPPTSDLPSLPGINTSNMYFHGQGLSLSLGTQIPSSEISVSVPHFQYQYSNPLSGNETFSCDGDENGKNREFGNPNGFTIGMYTNASYQSEASGFVSNNILHSKYLKPAQQLLDEVVNIRKELKQPDRNKDQSFNGLSESKTNQISSNPSESNGSVSELSPSERQDLQNKKTKLLPMLDEVDKRYNQYYHQMQALASSFEMVAGLGAARPYTSVALNRISRHFRCLRDAIKGQIRIIRGKLGEQETSDDLAERIPRLRYLDQRLRQQKGLHQQFGMVRPSWRPQRGLPENAVSILRAWLFEHFLHPYPKESEKMMLAKQTGLSKNQVANWFINARVRLWKPMIEDMYKEEFGDSETNSKSSPKEQRDNSAASQLKPEELQEGRRTFSSADNTNLEFSGQQQVHEQPKSDHVPNHQMSQPSDYRLDYHGFNLDNPVDYRFMDLGNQQDRFANPHQFHDFVV